MFRGLLTWIGVAGVLGSATIAEARVEPAARVALEARVQAVRSAMQESVDAAAASGDNTLAQWFNWSNWNNWNNWPNWGKWGNWFNR